MDDAGDSVNAAALVGLLEAALAAGLRGHTDRLRSAMLLAAAQDGLSARHRSLLTAGLPPGEAAVLANLRHLGVTLAREGKEKSRSKEELKRNKDVAIAAPYNTGRYVPPAKELAEVLPRGPHARTHARTSAWLPERTHVSLAAGREAE